MVLQVTTAIGAIIGALIALRANAGLISVVLGVVLLYSAGSMLASAGCCRRLCPPMRLIHGPCAPPSWILPPERRWTTFPNG